MASLREFAEEPGLWLPDDGLRELVALDGLTVTAYGSSVSVERIRLDGRPVEPALAEVRQLARARGAREVLWWIGPRATPDDLVQQLLALGLHPDPAEPELAIVTLERPPSGRAAAEVRRVATLADYRRALEIDWEAFNLPAELRERRRAETAQQWRRLRALDDVVLHLAFLEGRPVAFARTVFTPAGGLLLGGATLPRARRRGAYTSLVHARWREAVERGVPALGTAAGSMSTPVLLGLGFDAHGRVRLLLDRL